MVAAAGQAIAKPLPGGGQPNPLCASYKPIAPDASENAHSIGLWVTFGEFSKVDVYLITHHGKKTSGSPQMVWALAPRVAIMNNGLATGGLSQAWQTIHDSPGLADLWQLHFAAGNDAAHNAAESFNANTAA